MCGMLLKARTEGLKTLIGFNHLEITGILEAFLSRLCGGGRCQKYLGQL